MKVSDPNEEQLSTMSGEKFNLSTINAAICSLFTHQLFGFIYKTCSQSQINILILVLGSNNCVFFRSELSASCTFRSKAYYPAPTHVRWSVGPLVRPSVILSDFHCVSVFGPSLSVLGPRDVIFFLKGITKTRTKW